MKFKMKPYRYGQVGTGLYRGWTVLCTPRSDRPIKYSCIQHLAVSLWQQLLTGLSVIWHPPTFSFSFRRPCQTAIVVVSMGIRLYNTISISRKLLKCQPGWFGWKHRHSRFLCFMNFPWAFYFTEIEYFLKHSFWFHFAILRTLSGIDYLFIILNVPGLTILDNLLGIFI